MAILVDTNVLLRAVQPGHPMNGPAVQALAVLMEREEPLVVSVQNIAEFWNAATRPESNNGLGFSIEQAQEELLKLEGFFEVLPENAVSYSAWKELLVENRVSGVQVHDARLVALMKAYAIRQIVTFNTSDFARYAGIEAIHPDKIQ
ncbi:MAG TPA: type II toxin-antitoxin system VapC family toxin [Bryobacteraceae bacterium]|nr:type II toxin-antitoxin system VapC family toxin [Bryobacteraceae bacterium]